MVDCVVRRQPTRSMALAPRPRRRRRRLLPSMMLFSAAQRRKRAADDRPQKISGHHGATSPRKAADARASAPGRSSATRPAPRQLAQRRPAEVGGAERRRVEREVGLGVGALAARRRPAGSARRSRGRRRRRPRARRRGRSRSVRARERGGDVDERAPRARLARPMRTASGSVSISHSGSSGGASAPGDRPRQVLVEQEGPQQRARRRRGGDELADRHLARRALLVAVGAHRVERVAVGRRRAACSGCAPLARGLGVVEAGVPPRPGPVEHARALAADALVDRAHVLDVVGRRPRAQRVARRRRRRQARRGPAGGQVRDRARRCRSRSARRSRPPRPTAPRPARRAARTSSSWRRIIAVSSPRRRWVGTTPTAVTAAQGTIGAGHRHAGGCRCWCRRRCARRRTTPASAPARRCALVVRGGPPRSPRGGRPPSRRGRSRRTPRGWPDAAPCRALC